MVKYNPLPLGGPQVLPSGTPSDKGLNLTVYPLSRPNTNTAWEGSVAVAVAMALAVGYIGFHGTNRTHQEFKLCTLRRQIPYLCSKLSLPEDSIPQPLNYGPSGPGHIFQSALFLQ